MSLPTAGRQPLPDASAAKKVIAVVGANAPGMGLVSAICEDAKSAFAARAVVDDVASFDGQSLAELGVGLCAGHARDEAGLRTAFAGAYGAFYIELSSDRASAETKAATAHAVARAAKAAGLHHVIWATLEDPGQALLEHDDLTPTFVEGRWVGDGTQRHDAEEIFGTLGVPTTILQTSWDPSVAAGQWTEDIGRYAYTLFCGVESIGRTVVISAARLIRGIPPFPAEPAPAPARAPSGSAAAALATARRLGLPGGSARSVGHGAYTTAHKIAIAVAILAGGTVGLGIARQIVRPEAPTRHRLADQVASGTAPRPLPPPPPPLIPHAESAPAVATPPAPPPIATSPTPSSGVAVAASNEPAGSPSPHASVRHLAALKAHRADLHRASAVTSGPTPRPPSSSRAPLAPPAPAAVTPPTVEAHAATSHVQTPRAGAAPAVTAAPAPAASLPATPSAGYVDPKAVSAVVRAHAVEARACYDRAVMEHPDLRGRLTLRATIDPAGHVQTLTPTSTIVEGGRLQSCLTAAFRSWAFPAPAGGVSGKVSYAFSFDADDGR